MCALAELKVRVRSKRFIGSVGLALAGLALVACGDGRRASGAPDDVAHGGSSGSEPGSGGSDSEGTGGSAPGSGGSEAGGAAGEATAGAAGSAGSSAGAAGAPVAGQGGGDAGGAAGSAGAAGMVGAAGTAGAVGMAGSAGVAGSAGAAGFAGASGAGGAELYPCSGTSWNGPYARTGPEPILDNSCANGNQQDFVIDVHECFTVGSLSVGVRVSHTWRPDVQASLITPSGTVVSLIDFEGSGWDNIDVLLSDGGGDPSDDGFN